MTSRLCVVPSLFALSLISLFPRGAKAHPLLADDDRNKSWHAPDGSAEVIFIGDAKKLAPTIALKKSALTPAILSIETDGRGCDISGGASQLTIPFAAQTPNRTTKIILDAAPAHGTISLDGHDLSPLRGKWLQICLSNDPTVVITFTGATFVNIKSESAPVVVGGSVAANSGPSAAGLSSVPIASSSDVLDKARQSVFLIRTFDEHKEPIATGTGFVVRPDGFALTNFHVIHGALSASAEFNDNPKPVAIELRQLRPESDLALIKVNRSGLRPMSIEQVDPRQGDDVWALGYPVGLGYTVNRGIVSGLRRLSELPKDLRAAMTQYDPKSLWIQTDCTINHGNSGGPLINANGGVIGVNTWTLTNAANTNFALRANQAEELLKDVDAPPISFAEAKEKYKATKTMYGMLPSNVPHIEIPQTATASQVSAAAGTIATGHFLRTCSACGGLGYTVVKVRVGEHQIGQVVVPDFEARHEKCEACNGTGKQRLPELAVVNVIENLATLLAEVKQNDPKLQDALLLAHTALQDHVAMDVAALASVSAKAKGIMAQQKIALKTPIVARAIYAVSIPGDSESERVHLAVIEDTKQIVAITSPLLADEISIHEVLIGGLVSGTARSFDGSRIITLQNGFLIPMAEQQLTLPGAGDGRGE